MALTAEQAGRLAGGLIHGCQACLFHLALRFVLWREGLMPPNYVRFLDYAAERVFLRRVGGGCVFILRLVQELLATDADAVIVRVARLSALKH